MNVVNDMPFKLPMNTSFHMMKGDTIMEPCFDGVGPHACFAKVRTMMSDGEGGFNNDSMDLVKYYAWTGTFTGFDLPYWTDRWLEVTLKIPFIKNRVIEYTGYDHGQYCPHQEIHNQQSNRTGDERFPIINTDKYFLIDYTVPIDEPFVVSSVLRIPQEFPHHIVAFKEVLEETGDELLAWICSLYYGYENKNTPGMGSHNACNNLDVTFWQEFYKDTSVAVSRGNQWKSNVLGGVCTPAILPMKALIACILTGDPPVHHVAVYGSLRKGMGNHALLSGAMQSGRAVHQKTTLVNVPAQLYDTGAGFPALVVGPVSPVVVEKYKVNGKTFESLDRLEGYPHLYDRTQVIIDGDPCWIYFQKTASENYERCGHDWVRHCHMKSRRLYAESW